MMMIEKWKSCGAIDWLGVWLGVIFVSDLVGE
jgi:hypothetical protein